MKIIFLNAWFGKTGKPFFDFLKTESPNTDVFCFMEFSPDLFDQVSKTLDGYQGFLEKGRLLAYFDVIDCQAVFIKKDIKFLGSSKLELYKTSSKDTGFAFYLGLEKNSKRIDVLDVHGKALPGEKFDTPARIKQSQIIIDFMKSKKGIRIIGGDFNLELKTESIGMFEKAGYKNLIKDFNIENTRNNISWENYKTTPGFTKQHFADYVFVSQDVKLNKFEVPYNEVSDHLPQVLEIDI